MAKAKELSAEDMQRIQAERKYRELYRKNTEAARAIDRTLLRCSNAPGMIHSFLQNDIRRYGVERIRFALVNIIRKQLTKNPKLLWDSTQAFALENQGEIPATLFLTFYYTSCFKPDALNQYTLEFLDVCGELNKLPQKPYSEVS